LLCGNGGAALAVKTASKRNEEISSGKKLYSSLRWFLILSGAIGIYLALDIVTISGLN